mgnify:CR=1 FL=1
MDTGLLIFFAAVIALSMYEMKRNKALNNTQGNLNLFMWFVVMVMAIMFEMLALISFAKDYLK